MRFRVVVTRQAEQDLGEIFAYIALENPAAARRLVKALRRKLKTLATSPMRCPRAPEDGLDGFEIRHLVHDPHRIIFAVDGSTVVVLQVRHGARLPSVADPGANS